LFFSFSTKQALLKQLLKAIFQLLSQARISSWVKLKILASSNFLSAIYPEKLFYQTFM